MITEVERNSDDSILWEIAGNFSLGNNGDALIFEIEEDGCIDGNIDGIIDGVIVGDTDGVIVGRSLGLVVGDEKTRPNCWTNKMKKIIRANIIMRQEQLVNRSTRFTKLI